MGASIDGARGADRPRLPPDALCGGCLTADGQVGEPRWNESISGSPNVIFIVTVPS